MARAHFNVFLQQGLDGVIFVSRVVVSGSMASTMTTDEIGMWSEAADACGDDFEAARRNVVRAVEQWFPGLVEWARDAGMLGDI